MELVVHLKNDKGVHEFRFAIQDEAHRAEAEAYWKLAPNLVGLSLDEEAIPDAEKISSLDEITNPSYH